MYSLDDVVSFPPNFSESDLSLGQGNRSFYDILGVSPQSSQSQIRDAYRCMSKQYHPDTAVIDKVEAARHFQILNRAYDTLRFPEKRIQYDRWLSKEQAAQRQSRSLKVNHSASINDLRPFKKTASSAFLESEDRPLSPGEIFALFILGLTFLFCLLVAIFLGVSRGEMLVQSMPSDSSFIHQLDSFKVIPKKQFFVSPHHDSDDSDLKSQNSKMTENYSTAVHRAQQKPRSHSPLFPQ